MEHNPKAYAFILATKKRRPDLFANRCLKGVKEERLAKYKRRHAGQSKKGRGWEMTKKKELICGYNLYLTNASQEQTSDDDIFSIYSLRWQIELLFKIWKSILHIDHVSSMSIFRFECHLYGRLTFLLLSTEIMAFVRNTLADQDVDIELSEWKTMKLLKKTSID